MRCLTLVWIFDGISSSWIVSIQLQTWPVTPAGALHGTRGDTTSFSNETSFTVPLADESVMRML